MEKFENVNNFSMKVPLSKKGHFSSEKAFFVQKKKHWPALVQKQSTVWNHVCMNHSLNSWE